MVFHYYHPRMLAYDFGPQHPLKPDRLRRTITLLSHYGIDPIDPGPGKIEDAQRVHDPAYIEALSHQCISDLMPFGIGWGDNPEFPGMLSASLAYVAGSAEAARRVCEGAPVAFGLAGGLHHARRAQASGFCVLNDCAIACHILRERFARVAYVDIDVHHGCGVQWIFYEDPTVLTCSIHQDGRTLYPGSGAVSEAGGDAAPGSAENVPIRPGADGLEWLAAFRNRLLPPLRAFQPEAIVLQMGTDAHFADPLARLEVRVQEWLAAITDIRDLGLPLVALGGGGYALQNVPRMWTAAVLTLLGREVPEFVPSPFAEEWDTPTFLD